MKTDGVCSSERLKELVKYAVLAPSGHNSQPWKFKILVDAIEVHPDYNRIRPAVDPHNRELFISLGAAAENIIVAAEGMGLMVTSQIGGEKIIINILGTIKDASQNNLTKVIAERRTNRGEFWTKKIEIAKMAKIELLASDKLQLISDEKTKLEIAELVGKADLVWFKNKELMTELEEWLRDDVELTKDGLSTGVLNLYKVATELKYLFSGDNKMALENADKDKGLVMDAPLLAAVITDGDRIEDWVEAGKVYQGLALELTNLNMANSFLNRPLELTGFRRKLAKIIGSDKQVQLLVRIGYAKKRAKKSPRRKIEEVMM